MDKNFGTGALKITPGHDAVDFEIGQKHNLPVISIVDSYGKMINVPDKYQGMKVKIAREEIIKDLKQAGCLVKIEKIHHIVGTCYRDKGILEPLISKQWFIKVAPLAEKALTAIKKGKVKFIAKKYEKIAIHWLNNLKDWNISRQIVWGIQIPAWQCQECHQWMITDGEIPQKCMNCTSTNLKQDPDTFDTWFSSGQWPFATLMTNQPGDYEYFYSTSLMETAYDILPFWVIRMIMLGVYATNKVPFREVLIHGLVRDKEGQKISKSKGNVIDPILMTDKYGADSLRMGILWGALIENDIALSEDNIRGQRNFSNKIWNASRYVMQMAESQNRELDHELEKNLLVLVRDVTKAMNKYRYNQAAELLYDWFWNNYSGYYLEQSKKGQVSKNALLKTLKINLSLLHPFMPFVTEAIYQILFAKNKKDLLITAPWPSGK